jgi:DNA-binding XRE family transcriptional regulator
MRNRLKYYRNQREEKILQIEIAKLINMDPAQVSQMERGHYIPSLKVALAVSRAFTSLLGYEVSVNDLWELERGDL